MTAPSTMKHPRPRSSLARATLLRMGSRIAVVIVLATLLSYFHMLNTLRDQALGQLAVHVSERGQREQTLFLLAEDNHAVLKKALEERIRSLRQEELGPRFDSLFVQLPDGTVRSRSEGYDGTRMTCLFMPRGVTLNDGLRRRILASYEVLNQYGPAFHTRFTDVFITLPEGPHLSYWPDWPAYCHDAQPTDSIIAQEFFPLTSLENNPQRRTIWSGIYFEQVSRNWIATVSTPLDMDGHQVAAIGHDVLLEELIDRTCNERVPGTYNMLVRDDGQLIAHPGLNMKEALSPYNLLGAGAQKGAAAAPAGLAGQEAQLRAIFETAMKRPPGTLVQELPEYSEYVAAARLQGPGWSFITVMPKSLVAEPAFQAARYVLVLGVLSLLVELGLMYWVMKLITRPLLALSEATRQVAAGDFAGDFNVELDASRDDELGQMASAFQHMAHEVHRREEELRRANEAMEKRTLELKEVHQQLVQAARQAGMAEVATNVLHNVGNVLNTVYTSAQLAKERVCGMRLENLSRVTNLIEAHREDLPSFLTQDERGRHVRPLLSRLGQSLLEEREQIVALLDDVGRYTEHIGDIVKLQQNYAKLPRLQEPVNLRELVEDSLRINLAGLGRHHVKVERQLAVLPCVLSDKNKVLMILINLISNAKYALDDCSQPERRLSVKMDLSGRDCVRIVVRDNGVGLTPELLTRIFQYGFTTRSEGHGFGLHSCALAAQELGGTLEARSDGPGQGASFTLELPYLPIQEAA